MAMQNEIIETNIPASWGILTICIKAATNIGYKGKKTMKFDGSPVFVYQFCAMYKKCGASQ